MDDDQAVTKEFLTVEMRVDLSDAMKADDWAETKDAMEAAWRAEHSAGE